MVNELSLLNQGQRTEQRVSYELISNINGNVNRNFIAHKNSTDRIHILNIKLILRWHFENVCMGFRACILCRNLTYLCRSGICYLCFINNRDIIIFIHDNISCKMQKKLLNRMIYRYARKWLRNYRTLRNKFLIIIFDA